MIDNGKVVEQRRPPFQPEEAKFITQKTVTVFILLIFAGVCGWVFYQDQNESERATVLQTVINLAILAVSYWLGSSKSAADSRDQINKMIGPTPGTTTIAPPATVTVSTNEGDTHDPKN